MSLNLQFEVSLELLLAAFLSMVIGMDRERRDRAAGLRTHMLVGLGACLFTALSAHAFPAGDPTRVASNIVTGIGFLGAGTIIQRKSGVQNLTTAASIWSTAAVGMAVGLGAWFLAICAVLLIWVILAVLHGLEIRNPDKTRHEHEYERKTDGFNHPDDVRLRSNLPE
jgi:putative Mg2+ transporter-C (MgtC) family protein